MILPPTADRFPPQCEQTGCARDLLATLRRHGCHLYAVRGRPPMLWMLELRTDEARAAALANQRAIAMHEVRLLMLLQAELAGLN